MRYAKEFMSEREETLSPICFELLLLALLLLVYVLTIFQVGLPLVACHVYYSFVLLLLWVRVVAIHSTLF